MQDGAQMDVETKEEEPVNAAAAAAAPSQLLVQEAHTAPQSRWCKWNNAQMSKLMGDTDPQKLSGVFKADAYNWSAIASAAAPPTASLDPGAAAAEAAKERYGKSTGRAFPEPQHRHKKKGAPLIDKDEEAIGELLEEEWRKGAISRIKSVNSKRRYTTMKCSQKEPDTQWLEKQRSQRRVQKQRLGSPLWS